MKDVSLKFLTFKTVFLFALASGWYRSEINYFDCGSIAWSEFVFSARPILGFLT